MDAAFWGEANWGAFSWGAAAGDAGSSDWALEGVLAAVAEIAGDIAGNIAISGEISEGADVDGALALDQDLAGAIAAISGIAGVLERQVALASIDEPLIDAAEMADGSVWIACWSPTRPLLRLEGSWSRERVTSCNGMALSRITGQVTEVAAPAEAGTITGVVALHPSGWALAISGTTLQLWQYSAGQWAVVAACTPGVVDVPYPVTGSDDYAPYAIREISGALTVQTKTATYALQGSALVLADSFRTPGAGVDERCRRWQGRWYEAFVGTAQDDDLSDNDCLGRIGDDGVWERIPGTSFSTSTGGFAVRYPFTVENAMLYPRGTSGLAIDGAAGLLVMGSSRWTWRWGLLLDAETGLFGVLRQGIWTSIPWCDAIIHGGHDTAGRTWCAGRAVEIYLPGDLPVPRAGDYGLYLVEAAAGLLPAVYEERQSGGSDAGNDSPEVQEIRQAAAGSRSPTLKVYEVRANAGGDATRTIAVYELRQTAGGDAGNASPELYELRQGACCALGVVRVLEVRQWAYTDGGPAVGELVRFVVHDGDDQASAALVDCGPQDGLRVLMRGEPEDGTGAPAVDAWGTYQPVTPGCRAELQTPGKRVRVAVIKAAAAATPEISVQTRRESE